VGRLHHLRDPEAFNGYLRRTIVNLSKDTFRRRAVERSYLEQQTAELREGHSDRDVADYESMREALLSLPQRQRAAIVLRYFEDLHESEIADLLHCRPATVRSLVARGLEALRRIPEVTT
jgi:RNA polymerase sigma factor (sigma-70 family)